MFPSYLAISGGILMIACSSIGSNPGLTQSKFESPGGTYLLVKDSIPPVEPGVKPQAYSVIRKSDKKIMYQGSCLRVQFEWISDYELKVICPPGKPVSELQLKKFTTIIDLRPDKTL